MTKLQKIDEILIAIKNDDQFVSLISPYITKCKKKVLEALMANDINTIHRQIKGSSSPPAAAAARAATPTPAPVATPTTRAATPTPTPAPAATAPAKAKRKTQVKKILETMKFKDGEEFQLERKRFRVTKYLTEREDSMMYAGEWLDAPSSKQKDVFIKVQPSHKKTVFQVTTEHHIMTQLEQKGCATLSQRAIAYGCYNDDRYILISTLHGEDLTSIADGGNMNDIKRVATLAVDAIQSIHKCAYVHRDIKHENMVFEKRGSKNGNVVIIDYGLAESIYDRKGDRKTKGTAEGSPLFMAIQQHKAQPVDFMHDLQAIAYMILDLLGMLRWRSKGFTTPQIGEQKEKYLQDYKNGKLSGVDKVMGELIDYTDSDTVVDYNENHYKHVKNIIKKLA